jgi:hypothetical protein
MLTIPSILVACRVLQHLAYRYNNAYQSLFDKNPEDPETSPKQWAHAQQ